MRQRGSEREGEGKRNGIDRERYSEREGEVLREGER
jgi:hypothetical protein